jgi:hypothetical protein
VELFLKGGTVQLFVGFLGYCLKTVSSRVSILKYGKIGFLTVNGQPFGIF